MLRSFAVTLHQALFSTFVECKKTYIPTAEKTPSMSDGKINPTSF